jgi:signal peptidase I
MPGLSAVTVNDSPETYPYSQKQKTSDNIKEEGNVLRITGRQMSADTENLAPSKPEKSKTGWGVSVLVGAILAMILNFFFVNIYVVPSSSMEPTLNVGDYMLSVPAIDNSKAPQRGDIIVFHPPASWHQPEGTVFVKRVIAVGGDTVECCSIDGKVRVNDEEIDEPYMKGTNGTLHYNRKVPAGTVFVLGDNRENSADSRFHEDPFIPEENILGQPMQLIYPFNHFKAIN